MADRIVQAAAHLAFQLLIQLEARELADALWARSDVPAVPVFQFRLALVTLPTVAPSLETLRWAATSPGKQDMDPAPAAAIIRAWQERHPTGTAAWLATLEGSPEGAWIASALQDAASAGSFQPPAAPSP